MLRLAVTTRAETYERMQEPLADRSIAVDHVTTAERTLTPETDLGAFDVGFVFPPRLAEGGVADALLGVPWVNGREQVLRSRYKGETLARLSRAGLPTPETAVVSDPVDESALRETFRRFDPPVVVKPNSATRGIGVTKAPDLDSFLGVCDYLDLVHDYRATGDRSFLVQEYLENARDYRAMVVDGECVGRSSAASPMSNAPPVPVGRPPGMAGRRRTATRRRVAGSTTSTGGPRQRGSTCPKSCGTWPSLPPRRWGSPGSASTCW
jgi:SSU ribosomal protein S6P modification protein